MWARRQFATHMASSTLKGQHFDSFFGQFWLVLNPMLLALVYFLLTSVLGGQSGAGTSAMNHFVGLLTGLFAFFYTRNVIQFAASSITSGGKMIINMSFPKLLLPLSTTFTAMLTYFPTLLVYACFYIGVHHSVAIGILWIIPIFIIQTVFSFGLGLLFAAVTLYFRDMSTLLPYVLRIWMYITPVLFSLSYIKSKTVPDATGHTSLPHWILGVYKWDPFSPIINSWNTVLVGNGRASFLEGRDIKVISMRPPPTRPSCRRSWSVPSAPPSRWSSAPGTSCRGSVSSLSASETVETVETVETPARGVSRVRRAHPAPAGQPRSRSSRSSRSRAWPSRSTTCTCTTAPRPRPTRP